MNKLKETFNEHWEKLFFGVVAIFCLYSLGVSFLGMFGANNEEKYINELDKEISGLLQKGKVPPIDTKEKAVEEFKKAFENQEGFDKYNKALNVRLFSGMAKNDPNPEILKFIVPGHTSANAFPGPNCEKFFCKVKDNNICLVCGSKGDREYKFNAPKLTEISSLRPALREALESNPYQDRQKIRIIWEDDIETDRGIFKVRKGIVYRIEITEKNEKAIMEMTDKPTYQKDLRDFINDKNNGIRPVMKGAEILELVGENVGGALYKAPARATPEPKKDKPDDTNPDLFKSPEEKKAETPNAPPVENTTTEVKFNKLHEEKVFFNYEDTNFEPLKKYRYVLLELFTGESDTRKPLTGWKFSKPVDITTGAENIFYLLKATKETDAAGNPVLANGKQVYTATFQIYQYFRIYQNIKVQAEFYKKPFPELKIDDEIGSFIRKGDKVDSVIKTAIKKSKTEVLKGNDATVTDAEWTKWKEKYPTSMKARKDPIVIELSYFTGYKIIEIGEEDIKVRVKVGVPKIDKDNPTYDEKGNPILIQQWEEKTDHRFFVIIENTLTKVQQKIYSAKTNEIAEDLERNKVKTID